MELENFSNLCKNPKMKEKLEKLNETSNSEKQYRIVQIILEYINVCFLTQNRKINLKDSDIINIGNEYDKIDNELSKLIMRVNGLYNIYDENGVDEDDVDYLLYQVDKIYEIIRDKYGDI